MEPVAPVFVAPPVGRSRIVAAPVLQDLANMPLVKSDRCQRAGNPLPRVKPVFDAG